MRKGAKMKFIELSGMWICTNHVVAIVQEPGGEGSVVYMTSGDEITVGENKETVLAKIRSNG